MANRSHEADQNVCNLLLGLFGLYGMLIFASALHCYAFPEINNSISVLNA